MHDNITAETISIGTELLLGELTDTNSVYIAQQLRNIGINLFFMASVGDNQQRISSTIQLGLSRADLIITCGGLGPTVDDITRQAVAEATQRPLEFSPDLMEQITARFSRFNITMSENNRRQAFIPEGAIVIENPVGTAPSFIVEHEGKVVISLPGVPREMKYLMEHAVIPYLRKRYQLGIIKARILKTAGIGESQLDEHIGSELLNASNPTIGLAAHNGYIDVRITAKADTVDAADEMIASTEAVLKQRVGDYIFGYDQDRIETVLIRDLREQGLKIGICEAGLEGAVSPVFSEAGDVVTEITHFADADSLREVLSHDSEISSNVTLRELCELASQHLEGLRDSDALIIIVSTPETDENEDTNEMTVVLTRVGSQTRVRGYGFGGKSGYSREWVRTWSLSSVWRMLREQSASLPADKAVPHA